MLTGVLDARYNVIHVQAEAMSDLAAPHGRRFDALGEGRLLVIAPWPDRRQSAPLGKGQFELLNVLCRLISEL